jgi:hypothetical protein
MNNVTVNKSIRLSQHFTLGEMTRTGTGIPNIPSRVIIENLRNICENWLEELRRRYNERYVFEEGGRRKEEGEYYKGRKEAAEPEETEEAEEPIVITSGYRSPEVNRAVGGSPTSNHLTGCAVDIRCAGVEQAIRYAAILLDIADEWEQDFDELLTEHNRKGRYWVHFAVKPKDNRRKILFLQK